MGANTMYAIVAMVTARSGICKRRAPEMMAARQMRPMPAKRTVGAST